MITSNIEQIIQELGDFEKKQLPFATSLALNNTAKIAMKAMKHKIDKDFNVTASWNKVGGKYGIKKVSATKQRLYVDIYIPNTNTWMEDHETGDERTGLQLIPTKALKKQYPKLNTNRKIKNFAKKMLSDKLKNRIFEDNLNGDRYIFQGIKGKKNKYGIRSGKKLKSKATFWRRVPLFLIKQGVKEKATLDFSKTIKNVFEKNIEKEFYKALEYAVWTAR